MKFVSLQKQYFESKSAFRVGVHIGYKNSGMTKFEKGLSRNISI